MRFAYPGKTHKKCIANFMQFCLFEERKSITRWMLERTHRYRHKKQTHFLLHYANDQMCSRKPRGRVRLDGVFHLKSGDVMTWNKTANVLTSVRFSISNRFSVRLKPFSSLCILVWAQVCYNSAGLKQQKTPWIISIRSYHSVLLYIAI